MAENPFQSPIDAPSNAPGAERSQLSDRATYNVVADTLTGVNARWSDNLFQAVFILVSMMLAAITGVALAALNVQWGLPWFGGALIGALLGMVLGLFGSGIFLMIYRAVRHMRGKHD